MAQLLKLVAQVEATGDGYRHTVELTLCLPLESAAGQLTPMT